MKALRIRGSKKKMKTEEVDVELLKETVKCLTVELRCLKAKLKKVMAEHAKEDEWVEKRFAWYRRELTKVNYVVGRLLELTPTLEQVLKVITEMRGEEWYKNPSVIDVGSHDDPLAAVYARGSTLTEYERNQERIRRGKIRNAEERARAADSEVKR